MMFAGFFRSHFLIKRLSIWVCINCQSRNIKKYKFTFLNSFLSGEVLRSASSLSMLLNSSVTCSACSSSSSSGVRLRASAGAWLFSSVEFSEVSIEASVDG